MTPRYKLRTLLVAITAVAIVLAWAAYLRRVAQHHRREATHIVTAIATDLRGFQKESMLEKVERAAESSASQGLNSRSAASFHSPLRWSELEAALGAAVYHQQQAILYEKAVLRPWLIFWNEKPPENPRAKTRPTSEA